MIDKVRDIIDKLSEMNESVKVDDVQSRLKTVREDTVRQLRDKNELYVDGQNVIQFGKHKFSVNTQALELTTVIKDGDMFFHLSGTNYFEKVTHPELIATKSVWDQPVVSENREVYRGEYLAYLMLNQINAGQIELPKSEDPTEADEDTSKVFTITTPPRSLSRYWHSIIAWDCSSIRLKPAHWLAYFG